MIGASFERMKGTETIENGFRFFRKTMENGIRIVIIESQELDKTEEPIKMECFASSPLEPSEEGYHEILHAGLESGDHEKLRSAIRLSAESMGIHIRGISETNIDPMKISGDGVVYVSNVALGSMNKNIIEKEVTMILEQLKQYAQE